MPDDSHHRAATGLFRDLVRSTRLATSNYVLAETYTLLRVRSGHATAVRFHQMADDARLTGLLEVWWVDEATHSRAWSLFAQRSAQVLSFFDCTSFVLCRERTPDFVFGFDRDFVTMGFDVQPAPGATQRRRR